MLGELVRILLAYRNDSLDGFGRIAEGRRLHAQCSNQAFAREAGFAEVHVDRRISYRARESLPWETYVNVAPNPTVSTRREYITRAFTPAQFDRLQAHMKPLVGGGTLR